VHFSHEARTMNSTEHTHLLKFHGEFHFRIGELRSKVQRTPVMYLRRVGGTKAFPSSANLPRGTKISRDDNTFVVVVRFAPPLAPCQPGPQRVKN
jgi:hypothetical protein